MMGKRRFAFEVFEDGTVSFEGTECVPALGRQMKTLANERRREVVRLFTHECAAVTAQDSHCARGDTIRLVCGGVEKFEQTTCQNAPPTRSLEELLGKLVDAADLHEWVGPREHKCKGR